MSTWKKVALDGNILAAVGGGDQTNKLGGGDGTSDEIITSAASGGAGRVTLAQHELVVGAGGNASTNAQITGGDIVGTLASGNINLAIQDDKIDNGMLKDDIIRLAEIGHGIGAGSFGGADVDIRGGILYWQDGGADSDAATEGIQPSADDGVPAVAVPTSTGQVLTAQSVGGNLNPVWASPAGAGTIIINSGTGANAAVPVLFGSNADTGGLDAQKIYEDSGLAWKADASFSHAAATAGLIADTGFKGDLAGVATTATKAQTALASDNVTHYLLTTTTNTAQGGAGTALKTQEVISVKPQSTLGNSQTTISGNVSIGGNLTVSGDTTTLNTTELNVQDTEIQVASMDFATSNVYSENIQTATGDVGVGLVIFNGQGNGSAATDSASAVAADGFQASNLTRKARFLYHGHKGSTTFTASKSVLGWTIAQEGTNGSNETNVEASLQAVDSFGVGVMHINDEALSGTGGTSNLQIAVGAMALDTAGDLWIQTSLT